MREDGLFRAAERTLERSKSDPCTQLQRLESFVAAAKKKRRENDSEAEDLPEKASQNSKGRKSKRD